MWPMASARSKRIVFIQLLLGETDHNLPNDRQKQMRGSVHIMVDAMRYRPAATNVVWDVFDVGHGTRAGWHIHGGDLHTDAMSGLELVGGGEDLDAILQHLAGRHWLDGLARELVERFPGLGPLFVQGPIRRLQPSARKLPLRNIGGDRPLSLTRGDH